MSNMTEIEIKYIFSAGFRCYSPDTLKQYGLRPFSGPFDYLLIDFESMLKIVNEKMSPLLKDIVVFNKQKQCTYTIKQLNKLNETHVCYMAHDYNRHDLLININFLDDVLSGNMYDWHKICVFIHHDIRNKEVYDSFIRRSARLNTILEKYSEKTCLFHITRILTINIEEYMNNLIKLKLLYSIRAYIVVIVCCENLEDTAIFKEDILCIVKKVPTYEMQIKQHEIDNLLDYTSQIAIMKKYFNFQLVELSDCTQ